MFWGCQKVNLDVGAGSRRGRNMCKPIRKWVKLAHEGDIGREWKEVKNIPLGREWWKVLKRASIWVS
jgi:hypothetical protein